MIFILLTIGIVLNLGAVLGSFLVGDYETTIYHFALAICAIGAYGLFGALRESERECEDLRRRLDA